MAMAVLPRPSWHGSHHSMVRRVLKSNPRAETIMKTPETAAGQAGRDQYPDEAEIAVRRTQGGGDQKGLARRRNSHPFHQDGEKNHEIAITVQQRLHPGHRLPQIVLKPLNPRRRGYPGIPSNGRVGKRLPRRSPSRQETRQADEHQGKRQSGYHEGPLWPWQSCPGHLGTDRITRWSAAS